MPERMTYPESSRLRSAAFRATRIYPGPVGRVLQEELFAWEDFGYRFGATSTIAKLVDHLLTYPLKTEEAP